MCSLNNLSKMSREWECLKLKYLTCSVSWSLLSLLKRCTAVRMTSKCGASLWHCKPNYRGNFHAFTSEFLNHISKIIALIGRKPFYRESRNSHLWVKLWIMKGEKTLAAVMQPSHTRSSRDKTSHRYQTTVCEALFGQILCPLLKQRMRLDTPTQVL